ncbi:MAG TPA: DUF393 domain-containing protein [Candidatus Paceibacterota bacterium]|jgi:predicted DCC family thiol-disulfide oxidoreductase YuxK|nr:DUF393 domain-containing protein [Candidatus Paceibacterota bacterium]
MTEAPQRPKIYYDGVCNLCTGLIERIGRSSQADTFETVPIQTELPEGVAFAHANRDMYVRDESGRMLSGADAVLFIISRYPRMRWLSRIGMLPIIHAIASGLYRVLADNRYRIWGKIDGVERER